MVAHVSPQKAYGMHSIILSIPPSTIMSIPTFFMKSSVNPLLGGTLLLKRNSSKLLASAMICQLLALTN